MRTSYLTCLAIVATSLAATATSAVPARAAVNETTRLVVDEAVAPLSVLKLGTVILVRESVAPNTAEFTRMAGSRIKRRPRRVNRRSVSKHHRPRSPSSLSASTSGTNAPAPLDCSIESHPDCPRPTPPSSNQIMIFRSIGDD